MNSNDLLQQIQYEVGVMRQRFVRNHCMQLIRQMQQKCVPEYTSFVLKMAAEVGGNVKITRLIVEIV